ncbi:MAG: acetate/propionate family kinase [Solirubrobacteraceae bacterium]
MRVLVVNAGSSSLKLTLLDGDDQVIAARELDVRGGELDEAALHDALSASLAAADAVGHRIVHGGERFVAAILVDAEVEAALRELTGLAPLHQPKSLAALDAVSAQLPKIPAVACFDTAFHASMPPAAATYALPAAWRERWPIRRYGFHGLSHGWVARRAPQMLDRPASDLRLVSCHLGAGASLCAIADGRSVDTTMGFTPLEGLVMATRSGSVDPGLLVWLLEHTGMAEGELASALEHGSGLKGLAGSADMRVVLAQAADGDVSSRLALDVWEHRLRALIAGMAAALGGLDALVFTGGIGQRSAPIRARAVHGLGFLGVAIDSERNETACGDLELTADGAPIRTLVMEAREDLEIARQTRAVLATA